MRLPRDVSGPDLAKALRHFGYEPTRQTGSHLRVATQRGGAHHLTVPLHDALKVGTLAGIVSDVAKHLGLPRDEIVHDLFGK
jgi:predicted RNA binding protein YcfA (HicA-like mRNA interferase family)